jgi:hypothetical protein
MRARTGVAGPKHRRRNRTEPAHRLRGTAEIAKEAVTGKSVVSLLKNGRRSNEQLDKLLAPERMTSPDTE